MADNPFAGIVTPDVLASQRLQAATAPYQDQPVYTQLAARAGADLRNAMVKSAPNLWSTDDDRKAAGAQQIMQAAQSKYSDYIKDGKMTSDDAQAAVLEDAIRGFSANGNWEQAIALTQPLNALKQQQLERSKLKAETGALEAKPDLMAAQAEAAQAKSGNDAVRATAALQTAQAAMQNANTQAELTAARQALMQAQTDLANARAGAVGQGVTKTGVKLDSAFGQKQIQTISNTISSASGTLGLMQDVRKLAMGDPGALTGAGPIATSLAGMAATTQALLQGQGYNPLKTKEGADASILISRSIKDQQLQAKTLNLAFMLAKTLDPSGRLSNQDVLQAIQMVSGTGSPQSRLAVLDSAANTLVRQIKRQRDEWTSQGWPVDPVTSDNFDKAVEGYSSITKPKKAPAAAPTPAAAPSGAAAAGPPPGLTFEQFKAWKAAHPNWKG